MTIVEQKIEFLAELGRQLENSLELSQLISRVSRKNPWFTEEFVSHSINAIVSQMLNRQKLSVWLSNYEAKSVKKTVALIFAGNVPLVGMHDYLCCYIAGCNIKLKLSSKDDELFPFVLNKLLEIDPALKTKVTLTEIVKDFDAVIATGSDNTNRYFEYYFKDYPRILRKNRNSIAIVTGQESEIKLQNLANDIFMYFGFGCRNVSKLYVPVDYDLTRLFPAFEKRFSWMHSHNKYMSNYDYNRTILMLNKIPHLANEFVMINESASISSPIGCLHYETWHDKNILVSNIKKDLDKIQCVVVANPREWPALSSVTIGEAQNPELWDYADGTDTLQFLFSL